MTTPVEMIYEKKTSVLEALKLFVQTVAVQMACIVIDIHCWRLFKPCAKDIKGVSWSLTTSENFKPITYPMRAVDYEDSCSGVSVGWP